ncbi:nucleotidyltransferase domain-containing protein [Candidatus Parcubacteria bacterium]|nr:MAG: nucleotidyltransferase domain-containing protein [Candidatus Parcubacteria bacterium]
MRLSAEQISHIRAVIHECDPEARIYLFGSRVDDHKKGGDIDLLIFSKHLTERDKRRIRLRLYDRLGPQRIDIIIARDLSRPFVRLAYAEGVEL